MSHSLTAPSPFASLRRFASRALADPDSRSVWIGVLAVLLVHLLLFATAPYLLRSDPIHFRPRAQAAPQQFNIEIAPEEFVKALPKPPPPTKYVEANPNAPDNVPDKTNNFSSQNQQLAQEKPQPDQHNDKPKTEGKKDFQSNQVVSGQLTKPQDTVPVSLDAAKQPVKTETAPRQAQNPLSGYEKLKLDDDSFGSNLGKVADNAKPVPEKVDGANDSPLIPDAQNTEPAIDPKHPRARPVLQQTHTRPAIFEDNQFGTSNIGPIAYNAKWSSYGAYLHKMMEAIQIQWDRILLDSRTEPPAGSTVTVKFTLDSKGKITEILDVESTSSEQGSASCVSAITNTAPYGDWSDDMIAVLGNSQELTFIFYYQ
ncbi:MAG TPA: hypothetical protein VKG78_09530 [Opitutaceae bacterium]|nr:hypothetical protein [Opitutaceae bacterium]